MTVQAQPEIITFSWCPGCDCFVEPGLMLDASNARRHLFGSTGLPLERFGSLCACCWKEIHTCLQQTPTALRQHWSFMEASVASHEAARKAGAPSPSHLQGRTPRAPPGASQASGEPFPVPPSPSSSSDKDMQEALDYLDRELRKKGYDRGTQRFTDHPKPPPQADPLPGSRPGFQAPPHTMGPFRARDGEQPFSEEQAKQQARYPFPDGATVSEHEIRAAMRRAEEASQAAERAMKQAREHLEKQKASQAKEAEKEPPSPEDLKRARRYGPFYGGGLT